MARISAAIGLLLSYTAPMIDNDKIANIATQVATANLPSQSVTSVFSAPTVDSQGNEALHITIVLAPEAVPSLSGDAVLNNLVQIKKQVHSAGEDRFPIIEYATEDELEDRG